MRASAWFAASCVSFGAVMAHGADGLDLALRSRGAAARVEAVDASPAPAMVVHEAAVPHIYGHAQTAWLVPACHAPDACTDGSEGRLFYRGARRYMPAWDGLAAEGISLRRDRLVLRYSFR